MSAIRNDTGHRGPREWASLANHKQLCFDFGCSPKGNTFINPPSVHHENKHISLPSTSCSPFPSTTNVSTAEFFPVRPASPFLDSWCHRSAIVTFNFSPVVLDADWSTGWLTYLFPQTKTWLYDTVSIEDVFCEYFGGWWRPPVLLILHITDKMND